MKRGFCAALTALILAASMIVSASCAPASSLSGTPAAETEKASGTAAPDLPAGPTGSPAEESESSPAAVPSEQTAAEPTVSQTETPKEYCTVRFDAGAEGITPDSVTVEKGRAVTKPTAVRKNYILRRWLLNGKEYDFSKEVNADITLTAEWIERTNLPITLVELRNEKGRAVSLSMVDRENWVDSFVTVMNGDGTYETDSAVSTFKGRGNGSWGEAKKGYRIRFDRKLSLFGCARSRHWLLLPASGFGDQTLLRMRTAYDLARQLFDGLEYSVYAQSTDLYVNGIYQGVYLLCEQIRVEAGRIGIESEYGVNDTGFLIEYDAYAKGTKGIDYFNINDGETPDLVTYRFSVHYPQPDEYADFVSEETYRAQISYITEYVRRVYKTAIVDRDFDALAELVDVDSLVDMYILDELYKNTDAGWSSFYLYKKPGGKLYFGPPWDFDGTTVGARGEENDPNGIYVADTVRNYTPFGNTANELFVALYQNEAFLELVKARWQELSPKIARYFDRFFTNRFYAQNRGAFGQNLVKWFPKETSGNQTTAETLWINRCRALKNWFDGRIAFLDSVWG